MLSFKDFFLQLLQLSFILFQIFSLLILLPHLLFSFNPRIFLCTWIPFLPLFIYLSVIMFIILITQPESKLRTYLNIFNSLFHKGLIVFLPLKEKYQQ